MNRPGRYPTNATACPPIAVSGLYSSSTPFVAVAFCHVSSTSSRVRIGPFVASHVRHAVRFVPRLKYARIFSCAAIA
jgi:hypothetical protein